MLQTRVIKPAANAYQYPLLIKRLLLSGVRYERSREIVYRDQLRYDYRTLNERVARLANVLTEAGVKPGDTVAVMDWDSHRYLECMFAIPMIGAVVHTINVRLSPDQILYTMNHADDRFVLVNSEFVPLYQAIAGQLTTVQKTLLLTDGEARDAGLPDCVGEYESLLAAAAELRLPGLRRGFGRHDLLHHGHHRQPQRRVLHPSPAGAAHPGRGGDRRLSGKSAADGLGRRVHADHTDVPRACLGLPYVATMLGLKQVYPGRYDPEYLIDLWRREQVTFSHCVPTIVQMLLNAKAAQGTDFKGWKITIGGSALTRGLYDQAKASGMNLIAAYGMSETCPLISGAHINDELLEADEDTRSTFHLKAGVPVVLVDAAIQAADGSFLPADGTSQGELVLRALADPGLLQRAGEERGALGWRLAAYR